jgi:hypothetical protein
LSSSPVAVVVVIVSHRALGKQKGYFGCWR